MNTIDLEMVKYLISVASKYNPIMVIEDQCIPKIQREEKL